MDTNIIIDTIQIQMQPDCKHKYITLAEPHEWNHLGGTMAIQPAKSTYETLLCAPQSLPDYTVFTRFTQFLPYFKVFITCDTSDQTSPHFI